MRSRTAKGVFAGVVAGSMAFAFAQAVRPRAGQGRLIEWDEVRTMALERLRSERALSAADARRLALDYDRLAAEVEGPFLAAVGGLPRGVKLPGFEALDRRTWVDLNVRILSRVMEPLMDAAAKLPNSRLIELGRSGIDRYVAFLLAFLARRVLGQFDPQLLGRELIDDPFTSGELYLVEPNIAAWQDEAKLPGEELRRWLILHEMTHAWQFAAHPWLRSHLNSMLAEVIQMGLGGKGDPLSRLLSMTFGLPKQWAVVRRMQATMSLVEGYSNLVMNLVGRDLLPGFEELEAAYQRRSGQKSPLEVAFFKLTGLDMKLQQYVRGEAFSRAIYESHGMQTLNMAWESAETLPRIEELDNPEAWYRRVAAGRRQPQA
jgi:coenzyme F420 biosynthesis associated uncharacterized protein